MTWSTPPIPQAHYGDPDKGPCELGDQTAQLQTSKWCAPPCTAGPCPPGPTAPRTGAYISCLYQIMPYPVCAVICDTSTPSTCMPGAICEPLNAGTNGSQIDGVCAYTNTNA